MKRRVAVLAILILALVPVLAAAGPSPVPAAGSLPATQPLFPAAARLQCPADGDPGVILYWNADFDCTNTEGDPGYRQRMTPGWEKIRGPFNEQASSVRVAAGWSVRLYEHEHLTGASVCVAASDDDFYGDTFDGIVPLDDAVSSFRVFDNSDCSPPVVLYEQAGYGGTSFWLPGVGSATMGVGINDLASSIAVQHGWSARLYEDAGLEGTSSECFSSSDDDFADNTFEDGTPLNNAASSVLVFDQPDCLFGSCTASRSLACGDTDSSANNGDGPIDQLPLYSCGGATESGPESVYAFTMPITTPLAQRVTVTLAKIGTDLDLFVLDGVSGSCNAGNCIAKNTEPGGGQITFDAQPGQTYYIVVDGWAGATSEYELTVECANPHSLYLPIIGHP